MPTSLCTSLEVISRDLSPSGFVNTSSTNAVNSGQGSMASKVFIPSIPGVNIMARDYIKFLIFNGNGLEHSVNIGFSTKLCGPRDRSKMKR